MSTPPSAQPPPQNKSRKRRSADVVSFEDLLAAHKTERGPGQLPAEGVVLIGVDLELQRRMAERIGLSTPSELKPGSDAPNIGAPHLGAPSFEDRQAQMANVGAPDIGTSYASGPTIVPDLAVTLAPPSSDDVSPGTANPISSAPNIEAPNSGAPTFEAEFNLRDLLIRRTRTQSYVVHPISRIEDVFTSAERDLLRWLWERGRQVSNIQRIRLVTGPHGEGARRLATQAGLIYNTFKNLTRALSTKLALDIVKPERNLPTIYAVYHYSSILQRQRLAGFTGAVHKNGGGRELVNTKVQPAPRRPDLTVAELEQILGAHKYSAPIVGSGAPNFAAVSGNFGAPKIVATIRNKEYTSDKETTTASPNPGAPTIIVDALFHRTGRTDIDAARLITKGCIEANTSVSR